jgi:hypothetical protein
VARGSRPRKAAVDQNTEFTGTATEVGGVVLAVVRSEAGSSDDVAATAIRTAMRTNG